MKKKKLIIIISSGVIVLVIIGALIYLKTNSKQTNVAEKNMLGEDIVEMKPQLYNETKELLIMLKRDKIIDV